jgi:5-methylcytosine-specific restriction endonuclease McrA
MDLDKLKDALDIPDKYRVTVTKVSRGFNIRVIQPVESKSETAGISFYGILERNGVDMTKCSKCGTITYCQAHHIIPRSAGGLDDPENGIPLCLNCHTGNNAIHAGKWNITDVVDEDMLFQLKIKYKVIRG